MAIKRFFSLTIWLWFAALTAVMAQLPVNSVIDGLLSQTQMRGSSISFLAVDCESNTVLAEHDQHRLLSPASVQKLITTATALSVLKPQQKFRTILALEGEVSNGVLYGDVVLIGGGDPTFGSDFSSLSFPQVIETAVGKLRAAGIDSIRGSVLADPSIFQNTVPGTYIWKDMANYYAASATGLAINHNEYTIELSSQEQPGTDVIIKSVKPEVPGLQLQTRVKASSVNADMAYIYGAPFTNNRIIRGTIPAGRSSFPIKGSLPDPAAFAAYHLYRGILSGGIDVSGDHNVSANYIYNNHHLDTLAIFYSPALSEIVAHTNKRSDNLFAETLLKHIGLTMGEGSTEQGLIRELDFWHDVAGIDLQILDGSGLSPGNALSASQLVAVLVHMYAQPEIVSDFVLSLPLAGVEGTVRSFGAGTGLQNNARIKSGSMEGVRSYAGYLTTKSGREVAFAFLVNHYGYIPSQMKQKMEEVMVTLYNSY